MTKVKLFVRFGERMEEIDVESADLASNMQMLSNQATVNNQRPGEKPKFMIEDTEGKQHEFTGVRSYDLQAAKITALDAIVKEDQSRHKIEKCLV